MKDRGHLLTEQRNPRSASLDAQPLEEVEQRTPADLFADNEMRPLVVALFGGTGVGKSSLLNALTNSEVEAADKLFMTLDPTSRRLRFPREGEVVITDTVGFISDLPPDLVSAFRATLEELADADLLLHVADAADPNLESKLATVQRLLVSLELAALPQLLVLNKSDLVSPVEMAHLVKRYDGVAVSAIRRRGLEDLIEAAEERLGAARPFIDHEKWAASGSKPTAPI